MRTACCPEHKNTADNCPLVTNAALVWHYKPLFHPQFECHCNKWVKFSRTKWNWVSDHKICTVFKILLQEVNKPAVNMQVSQIQNWGWISCGDQIEARKPVWYSLFFLLYCFHPDFWFWSPVMEKLEPSTSQLGVLYSSVCMSQIYLCFWHKWATYVTNIDCLVCISAHNFVWFEPVWFGSSFFSLKEPAFLALTKVLYRRRALLWFEICTRGQSADWTGQKSRKCLYSGPIPTHSRAGIFFTF
jgi:hypothetical protein